MGNKCKHGVEHDGFNICGECWDAACNPKPKPIQKKRRDYKGAVNEITDLLVYGNRLSKKDLVDKINKIIFEKVHNVYD